MCAIEIMECILGSPTLVVNIFDNMSALRRATIHQEVVKSLWKQADLISQKSGAYHSIDSGMLLVHIYVHHNSVNPTSTLTPLALLNVRLDPLSEHVMAEFLLSLATRNIIAVGFSDPCELPSTSIHGVPIHSNIAQSITY